ncbi:MAG: DUF3958 family protein [Oscillospiraceae bacterium]|nr:DUF3958 family protein [Oscillospiraceae bacterium]
MKNEIDYEIKNISDELSDIEVENRRVKNTLNQIDEISYEKDMLFNNLKDTWKNGEMFYMIDDTEDEIKKTQCKIIDQLEDNIHNLTQRQIFLESKQEELKHKRNKIYD